MAVTTRAVCITGAGGGIGRAGAMALARRGYRLGLFDRDAEMLEQTRGLCERLTEVATVQGDVSIRSDVVRLEEELAVSEKALPADFKSDYQRVVRSKGADSLATVEDGVCTGCGQQITLNMQNELKLSRLVFCKSCGRLLYMAGE